MDRQAQEFPTLGSATSTGKPKTPAAAAAASGAWGIVDKSIVERGQAASAASSAADPPTGETSEESAPAAPVLVEKAKPLYLGADYLPEPGFTNVKPGYDFRSGPLGLGYYWHEYVDPAAVRTTPGEAGDDFGGLKRSSNAWKPRSQR